MANKYIILITTFTAGFALDLKFKAQLHDILAPCGEIRQETNPIRHVLLESIKIKRLLSVSIDTVFNAPHSDITRYQNLCTIPSSSRICIQISLTYPALPKTAMLDMP